MIYLVDIEGHGDLKVELSETERGVWKATIGDDQTVDLELRGRAADGAYLFAIGDEVRKFHLDKNCTKYLLAEGEEVSRVEVERAGDVVLDHARHADKEPAAQLDTLESNITGIVLDILVRPGQQVEKGDPVVIVEAMKMENTLTAPMSGTVEAIAIEEGQTVYAGDEMVTFT